MTGNVIERNDLLTPREETILAHVSSGRSNKEIARVLGVTPETIKTHLKRIFRKLSAGTRAQAVARATDLGLLDPITGDGFEQELFRFHGSQSSLSPLTR
jgi:DNA-binding CsgD family transcriptional regulator